MPHITKNSDDEFIETVKNSFNIAEVLRKLGLSMFGASYKQFKIRVKRLNLSTDHFTGQGHLKGKAHNWSKAFPLSEIMVENSTYSSGELKKRLIKSNILENKCNICGIFEWLNNTLQLHLDHINGINNDNRLENLRLLCPNCHSQTSTYCRGQKLLSTNHIKYDGNKIFKGHFCIECNGSLIKNSSRVCKKCYNNNRNKYQSKYIRVFKIEWPNINDLVKMIEESSYVQVGKKLGVSDNAIRHHIKKYKVEIEEFESPPPFGDQILNLARLPITPYLHSDTLNKIAADI